MKSLLDVKTPVGTVFILANSNGIEEVSFKKKGAAHWAGPTATSKSDTTNEQKKSLKNAQLAAKQIQEYFSGKRESFSLPYAPQKGTSFQKKVWKALTEIPYGQTKSYGQIAKEVGSPLASRAVGLANKKNPLAIVVPCHRVVGSTGALVGYDGGINKKIVLLKHEGVEITGRNKHVKN